MTVNGELSTEDLLDDISHAMSTNANRQSYTWSTLSTYEWDGDTYQLVSYWDVNESGIIGIRVNGGSWTYHRLDGTGSSTDIRKLEDDNHNTIQVMLDRDGYIHMVYNLHSDPLQYRISTNTVDSFNGAFGADRDMLGVEDVQVTYPCFFRRPDNEQLMIAIRSGIAGDGALLILEYEEDGQTWSGVAGTTNGLVIDSRDTAPSYSPYWYGPPKFTDDWDGAGTGKMYVAWTWRKSIASTDNWRPTAIYWDGTSWLEMDGTSQTIPVTYLNSSPIQDIGFIRISAFSGSYVDSSGRLHVAYTREDDDDERQIYHGVYDSGWTVNKITNLTGAIFSPVVLLIDGQDAVHILYHLIGDDLAELHVISAESPWTSWEISTLVSGISPDYEISNGICQADQELFRTTGVFQAYIETRGSVTLADTSGLQSGIGFMAIGTTFEVA